MSLVELLIALTMAGLIIALVLSVLHTVSVTLRGQERRAGTHNDPAAALQTIADDLSRTFIPMEDATCAFVLKRMPSIEGPATDSSVSFCITTAPEDEIDLRWYETSHIAFQVHTAGPERKLTRLTQDLAGPGASNPARTNTLAESVSAFSVEVYDGDSWHRGWPPEGHAARPKAARIELVYRSGHETHTNRMHVSIPVGMSITSTVARSRTSG